MTIKALLVAILFFGSVTVAGAQAKTSAPTNGMEPVTSVALGWNYVRPSNCTGINGFYYLIDTNGGVWYSNDKDVLIALAPACQSGNWIAFHVINTNGAWDQLYTFTFK
ncbi:MAG: hypothetical protein ACREQ2_01530 [Candidatus Binatia bacterium]